MNKSIINLEVLSKKMPKNLLAGVNPLMIRDALISLAEAYKEGEITKREIASINAKKEVLIMKIRSEYSLYRYIFKEIFSERKEARQKCFEIIDAGLAKDDKELISMGLQGLSQIVTSSPIGDAMAFKQYIESGGKPEL